MQPVRQCRRTCAGSTTLQLRVILTLLEEARRVLGDALLADLEVQMRAGGTPGRADRAEQIATPQQLPRSHIDARQMGITGNQPFAMVNLDQMAKISMVSR